MGNARDVRNVRHYGTGDLEVSLWDMQDLEWAKPLFLKRYENS
jgi:predicted transport protein